MLINLFFLDLARFFGIETSCWYGLIILYLGPETMMPVASALAGIIGAVIMFWQRLVRGIRKFLHYLKSRSRKTSESRKPA